MKQTITTAAVLLATAAWAPISAHAQELASENVDVSYYFHVGAPVTLDFAGDISIESTVGGAGGFASGEQTGCLSGGGSAFTIGIEGENRPAGYSGFYLWNADNDVYLRYLVEASPSGNSTDWWTQDRRQSSYGRSVELDQAVRDDTTDLCGQDVTLVVSGRVNYSYTGADVWEDPTTNKSVYQFKSLLDNELPRGLHTFTDTLTVTIAPDLLGSS